MPEVQDVQSQAPWESYNDELTEKLDPKLEAEVAAYAQRRHDSSSAQNKEELHRQQELNNSIAKQYQWISPSEYQDEGPRVGRVMGYDQFIGTLREKCGVKCWYRQHPHADKLTLVYSDPDGMTQPQVGCWAQNGMMPEFSFVRFDEHGVPVDEKRRGWRTCLLQLILKGVVSEAVAHKAFGPARGPAAERYNQILYDWRNKRTE